MSDKMREAFEHYVATKTLLSLEKYATSGSYKYSSTQQAWETWKAAQSVSVPVVANGMLEKFKAWKDERIGRHALIEPLEWFAGGYACAASNHAKSVPVVGEVVLWALCEGKTLMYTSSNRDAMCANKNMDKYTLVPLVVQPTYSITAAELERLRKDEELKASEASAACEALQEIIDLLPGSSVAQAKLIAVAAMTKRAAIAAEEEWE